MLCEVATVQSCPVGGVNDDASVAKIGWRFRVSGEVEVKVGDLEVLLGCSVVDGAVFAAQITALAGRWLISIAWWCLAAAVRVEVAACARAVAIFGNRVDVDVVC